MASIRRLELVNVDGFERPRRLCLATAGQRFDLAASLPWRRCSAHGSIFFIGFFGLACMRAVYYCVATAAWRRLGVFFRARSTWEQLDGASLFFFHSLAAWFPLGASLSPKASVCLSRLRDRVRSGGRVPPPAELFGAHEKYSAACNYMRVQEAQLAGLERGQHRICCPGLDRTEHRHAEFVTILMLDCPPSHTILISNSDRFVYHIRTASRDSSRNSRTPEANIMLRGPAITTAGDIRI
jgi:hypothetical protein